MKTARFSDVVKRCGEPEAHLVFMEPSKDRELQSAVKSKRVMTVFQNSAGSKADHGIVGFEPGAGRQFLIFPKALTAFAGKNIVGIKYELLSQKVPSKAERAGPVVVPKKKKKTPKPMATLPDNVVFLPGADHHDHRGSEKISKPEVAATKVSAGEKLSKPKVTATKVSTKPTKRTVKAKAEPARKTASKTEDKELDAVKSKVRDAMEALEQGKQIAAFNILKRIVDG